MKRKVIYCKPKLLRRICAAVIDLLLVIVLSVLFSLAVSPLLHLSSSYQNNSAIYNQYAVNSGLYNYSSDGTDIVELTTYDEDVIKHFYYTYVNDGKKIYDDLKKKTGFYDYDESTDTFTVKGTTTSDQINSLNKTYYSNAINKYYDDYVSSIAELDSANYVLSVFELLELSICLFLGLSITYIVIPLIFKDGKSFGKLLFKLQVVSTVGDGKVSKLQVFFRGVITGLLELLASLYVVSMTYVPLFLVISFIIMLVNKKQMCFHDLACSTLVIDTEKVTDLRESEKIEIVYLVEEVK